MKSQRSYSKLSRKTKSQQGLTTQEESAVPAVKESKPGPLSVSDLQSEMLRQAGFSLDLIKKSVATLERNLTSKEPFAQLQAAKLLLQLANAFPSKTAQAPSKMEVVVTVKPFAQVIESTSLPALPEAEDAELTGT